MREEKCAVLGASGHGKVVAEIAELNCYGQVEFFDDRWPQRDHLEHWKVVGGTQQLLDSVTEYDLVVVAIGNNEIRLTKQLLLEEAGAKFSSLVHPTAVISGYSSIGAGSVVMANAVVNPFTSVGKAGIVNTSATVDHDCLIADGVHISPGANLAGGVTVGEQSWVGVGAQVKQLVTIGKQVVVGAGATVINDVSDFQTVIGAPAKPVADRL